MSSGGASLQPTFTGHVATTQDALLLFEACLQGHLSHVPRRPHDRERNTLIRSGCVFIYEENASGIKRWTDGVTWSPSRILGNFLVYRELDKPFPPGEKKRAMKKPNRRPSRPGEPYPRPDGSSEPYSPTTPQSSSFGERTTSEMERQLIGSLVDSYGFKHDGLVKKTMSVTVQGVTHHLVSYYNVNDVMASSLRTPSQTENLQYIRPRVELTHRQSFRAPLEEGDDLEGMRDPNQARFGYRMAPQGYTPQHQYYMQHPYPPMSNHPPASGGYTNGVPAMSQPYLHTPVPAVQIPQQREYASYEQPPYNRSYESLQSSLPPTSQSRSIPPTPTSATASMLPNRASTRPSSMYPPPNMQPRPIATNLSPISMDSRNTAPYNRASYSLPSDHSPVDAHRQLQSSPQNLKYEDRRDSQPTQGQMYATVRPPYYSDSATAQMGQSQYHQPPSIAHWSPSQGH